jgi:hypothetical protein
LVIVTGMATDVERLTRDYWRAVQRVRRMAETAADKVIVLADVEVIYRRERVRKLGALLAQSPTKTDMTGNTRQ